MRFFKPSKAYLEYLYNIDQRIIKINNTIGIPLRLNELIYFLPIDSPDDSDYDENHHLKKSTPAIMRMIDVKTQQYYGKCLLSNMFSIPYKELIPIEMTDFNDSVFVIMEKKLEFLRKNIDRITHSANRIYKQKMKGYKQEYLKATLDFKKLEEMSIKWEIEHYGKHINRFPDNNFFLTNPFTDGVTDYFLMNKERQVAIISIDNVNQNVLEIKAIINKDYAPLECFKDNKLDEKEITVWFKGRGIPSWRDGLDDLLDNLGIKDKDTLLNKAYGLSLSDQYWMNPVNRPLEWHEINFFENDFNSKDFFEASFEDKILNPKKVDFFSPNNTSDGMLKKAWIVGNDGERYLLKSSFKQKTQEPFNEILACMISEVIGLNYVSYSIEIVNRIALSKCRCFIDKNTEFISAYSILKYYGIDLHDDEVQVFNSYINILKAHKIQNAEKKILKMFILDYLIINQDRHLGNFGIIRNVETLEWKDIAPNFDNGQSMYSQNEIYEMNFENASGCFFNKKEVNFERIIDLSLNKLTIDIDFDMLEKIPERWKTVLLSYQHITMINDERINELIHGLEKRIYQLKVRLLNGRD